MLLVSGLHPPAPYSSSSFDAPQVCLTARDVLRPDAIGVAGARSTGQTPGRRPAAERRGATHRTPLGVRAWRAGLTGASTLATRLLARRIVTRRAETPLRLRRRSWAAIEPGPEGTRHNTLAPGKRSSNKQKHGASPVGAAAARSSGEGVWLAWARKAAASGGHSTGKGFNRLLPIPIYPPSSYWEQTLHNLPVDTLIPKGATINSIIDHYSIQEKIRCGKADCRTLHNNGVVVSFTCDGVEQSGVIGCDCATLAFGESFVKAERLYEATQRDMEVASAVDRFHVRAARISPELEAALPHLSWQSEMFNVLDKAEPKLTSLCQRAVKSQHDGITLSGKLIHRVRGGLHFWDGYRGALRARKLQADIFDMQAYLASDNLTSKGLKLRLPDVIDIERRWAVIERASLAADEALRPGHMTKLVAAANAVTAEVALAYTGHTQDWTLYVRMQGTLLEISEVDWEARPLCRRWVVAADLANDSHP